ncbi:MAG: hypothetical protein GY778_17750, partial [bacterium]|nr:hypothetical protein [bacterium]
PAPEPRVSAGPSCKQSGKVKSRESSAPVTVTFVNRTGSYRGVMWIDFKGQPVEFANLDAGQSYTAKTYLTHPWMFTDGPGNCIDIFMPRAGLMRFEITAASPAFGPGND